MLKYTRAAFSRIVKDLKLLTLIITVIMQSFMIAYLTASIILDKGNLIVNAILLGLTAVNFIFYLVTYGRNSRLMKKVKGRVSRTYSVAKLSVNAISLASVIYSIYVGASDITGFTMVMTPLMIILWVMQVLFQLTRAYVENRKDLLMDGIQMDFEIVVKPYMKVRNAVHDFFGDEREDEDVVSRKNRAVLEAQAEADGIAKKEKRASKRAKFWNAVRSHFNSENTSDTDDKEPVTGK